MNLLVFTKRVPATQEEELRIVGDGQAVDLSKVPFKVNDWDNYAVEEAVRMVEKTGGAVTAVSMGDAESDEVLRRAIAMGAKDGFLSSRTRSSTTRWRGPASSTTSSRRRPSPSTRSLRASSRRTTSSRPWAASWPPSWACPMRRW